MDKDKWMPILIAALLGTSTGGGTATAILGQHAHPEIIAEIREVEYESEIFKLEVQLESMDPATSEYKVAESQLLKFNDMLLELKK